MPTPPRLTSGIARYHLTPTFDRPGWRCDDRLQNVVGWGTTPERALSDCQLELEMLTDPDLHK